MIDDRYKPYVQQADGKYDLTRFDPVFWNRFRKICENLQQHGIVMHMLMFPHNGHVRGQNWRQSLFNPVHNINDATTHLADANHYKFWHSVADEESALWEIQRAAIIKVVELTADLDNVYYDLSHEFRTDCCGAHPTDWNKAKEFFEAVAHTLRTKYCQLQPAKKPLIGLDAEHFAKAQQLDWNFGNPAFDLMILGNSSSSPVPSVETVAQWCAQYQKPFLLQEGGADDDHGGKLGISYNNTDHVIGAKYVWKWMMAKNQLIDIYQKQLNKDAGYPDDYQPAEHNPFEQDATILRSFWNSLNDYGNLDYRGQIVRGPGDRQMVLSSQRETIAYFASEMGRTEVTYDAQETELTKLSLRDGDYIADKWDPDGAGGLLKTEHVQVRNGTLTLPLPSFVDDLAVHIYIR